MKTSVHHLDVRGAIVPITLLKVTGAFREIKPGEILEILGSDPDTRKELFQVLNAFRYQLMDIEEGKASYRIRLKKG
ncbi:sulfurtransferase TusA family protein [Desulfococcaceae bacterium HSG8]|nr:sulfurtransferase TusA family protein [Desulfococcaceae bacterium HSG8]